MIGYAIYRVRRGSFSMELSTLLVPLTSDDADPLTNDLASGYNANVWEAEFIGAINLREDA